MSSPRLIVTDEDDGEESNSKTDTPKYLDGIENDAPKNFKQDGGENKGSTRDEESKRCLFETSVSSTESEKPPLGQFEAGEEDEGFRTPTSLDHRIPDITQCPPAPKKIRPSPSTKRKEISPRRRKSLHLDLSSTEVESNFPPKIPENDTNPKMKKSRREDSE